MGNQNGADGLLENQPEAASSGSKSFAFKIFSLSVLIWMQDGQNKMTCPSRFYTRWTNRQTTCSSRRFVRRLLWKQPMTLQRIWCLSFKLLPKYKLFRSKNKVIRLKRKKKTFTSRAVTSIRKNLLQKWQTKCLKRARNFEQGRTGYFFHTVHGRNKQPITDHKYQNFTFPNHENYLKSHIHGSRSGIIYWLHVSRENKIS